MDIKGQVDKSGIRYESKIGHPHHDHMICVETGKIIEFVSEDIEDIFALQASQEKSNIVQSIGNQNPWKDELPAEEVLNRIANFIFDL